jgi:hypothetical protein
MAVKAFGDDLDLELRAPVHNIRFSDADMDK